MWNMRYMGVTATCELLCKYKHVHAWSCFLQAELKKKKKKRSKPNLVMHWNLEAKILCVKSGSLFLHIFGLTTGMLLHPCLLGWDTPFPIKLETPIISSNHICLPVCSHGPSPYTPKHFRYPPSDDFRLSLSVSSKVMSRRGNKLWRVFSEA